MSQLVYTGWISLRCHKRSLPSLTNSRKQQGNCCISRSSRRTISANSYVCLGAHSGRLPSSAIGSALLSRSKDGGTALLRWTPARSHHRAIREVEMNGQFYRFGSAAVLMASAAIAIAAVTTATPQPAMADNCPAGGTVRLGVEPYDTAARLVPI